MVADSGRHEDQRVTSADKVPGAEERALVISGEIEETRLAPSHRIQVRVLGWRRSDWSRPSARGAGQLANIDFPTRFGSRQKAPA